MTDRLIRLREGGLGEGIDGILATSDGGVPRILLQVIDGGSKPATAGKFFLGNPVDLDGDEEEGTALSVTADASTEIPFLILGSPSRSINVGDIFPASFVGGRWVSENASPGDTIACWPCAIPTKDLAVDWTNSILGNGTATLVFTEPSYWASGCHNGLLYSFACPGVAVAALSVAYFLSGSCPDGQWQACSNLEGPPLSLLTSSWDCDAFEIIYTLDGSGCPFLAGSGYTQFRVYDPTP